MSFAPTYSGQRPMDEWRINAPKEGVYSKTVRSPAVLPRRHAQHVYENVHEHVRLQ